MKISNGEVFPNYSIYHNMKGVFCIDKIGFLRSGNIYCHYYLFVFITCVGIHTYTMASASDQKKNTEKGL